MSEQGVVDDTICKFRAKASAYFERNLLMNGYDPERAQDLGFYIAKLLEDTLHLHADIENDHSDADEVLDHVHMLYANKAAFETEYKLLMQNN